mmetsp:Transcript_61907/g.164601  ORF Transcript_61907/g.164601 Transcript_61907/m.164601 type:complete len:409 (-) Transcript_61907:203-1429(-)
MGTRGAYCVLACIFNLAPAQLPAREGQSGYNGVTDMLDSRLIQTLFKEANDTHNVQPAPGEKPDWRLDEHSDENVEHAPRTGRTPLTFLLQNSAGAGATSLWIEVSVMTEATVGDCFTLEGDGNSETVCCTGFSNAGLLTVLMSVADPTQFAYTYGAVLTLLTSTTTTTTTTDHASMHDDPHVCALSGECYDIRKPSEYILLRAPFDEREPARLELSGHLDTDGVQPCGLFVKQVALTGSWLNHQVVRVRPHTRDVGGSNWAGTATRTNFSLQLGDSPWRSFTQQDPSGQLAVVGRVAVRFVRREQFGDRMEAQSLEFAVGGMGPEPARITVSQASHQALNLDVSGLERLGYARVAGVLGTEGHPASIEEPAPECAAAARSATQGATRRQTPQAARKERASTLSASWQ